MSRRWLFRLFYVGLLVVVGVTSEYLGRNFTGSGPAPTRSAFAGRLPGAPDGAFRRIPFFCATNRDGTDPDTFGAQGWGAQPGRTTGEGRDQRQRVANSCV